MTHLKPTRAKPNVNEKVFTQEKMTRDNDEKYTRNSTEDRWIDAIDEKKQIVKFMKYVDNLQQNKSDVQGFFQGLAPEAAISLMLMALSEKTSEKGKLDALKDILDRAGHGKVTKHAVAALDPTMSKEAILSILMGADKDLKSAGVEIIDDDTEDKEE